MRRRFALVTLIFAIGIAAAAAQPAEPPAAAPTTTQAAPPDNPLVSPASALAYFRESVNAAADAPDDAARDAMYRQAMTVLNFSALDPEKVRVEGPEYVQQLAAIIARLDAEGLLWFGEQTSLPDDPLGMADWVQSFGRNPIVLVLERYRVPVEGAPDGVQLQWKFAPSVVTRIPGWHSALDELVARIHSEDRIPAPPKGEDAPPGLRPDALRSPRQTIRFFLEMAEKAENDGAYYAAARECLDFTDVAVELLREERGDELDDAAAAYDALDAAGYRHILKVRDEHGLPYVDALELILDQMIGDELLDIEEVRDQPGELVKPTWAIGRSPLLVVLARQGDDQWRFSAATVQRALAMAEPLKKGETVVQAPAATPGTPAAATPAPQPIATPKKPAADALAPEETATPRATVETFQTAMLNGDLQAAVNCLDLSHLSPAQRDLAGTLAGKLWLVFQRHPKLTLKNLPNDPDSPTPDPLFPPVDEGRVVLRQQQRGDRKGEWLISSRTVRDIEALYEHYERQPIHADWTGQSLSFWTLPSLWVREQVNAQTQPLVATARTADGATVEVVQRPARLPGWLLNSALGLRVWQWFGILLTLLCGVLVRMIAQIVLRIISARLLRVEGAQMMPSTLNRALSPTSNLAAVATWWYLLQLLDLGQGVLIWMWPVLKIVMAVVGVYAFYRLVEVVMGFFAARAAQTASRMDDVLVPLLQKTLKAVVVAMGAIFVINVLGYPIDRWLAALGVGGLAISFAARDTIANFFGSVNVVLDRPFQVGDWVKIGDAEGTVEAVGLRSSRIRTFYNSQVVVPNAELMNATVDNLGRRRYRRTSTAISVIYGTTPEQLEAFCEGIREIIRQHPYTRKDYFHVYVKQFAASSIDVMLYCFHECPDWGTELRERHRLYLDIMRLARRLGIEFAFPTQTIHIAKDDPDAAPPTPPETPAVPPDARKLGRETAEALVAELGNAKARPPVPTLLARGENEESDPQ
jgi:MscS family membrane protein